MKKVYYWFRVCMLPACLVLFLFGMVITHSDSSAAESKKGLSQFSSAPVVIVRGGQSAIRGFEQVTDNYNFELGELLPNNESIFSSGVILLGYSDVPVVFHFSFDSTRLQRVERSLDGNPLPILDEIAVMFKLGYEGLNGYQETEWMNEEEILNFSDVILPVEDNRINYTIQLKLQSDFADDAGQYIGNFQIHIEEYIQ